MFLQLLFVTKNFIVYKIATWNTYLPKTTLKMHFLERRVVKLTFKDLEIIVVKSLILIFRYEKNFFGKIKFQQKCLILCNFGIMFSAKTVFHDSCLGNKWCDQLEKLKTPQKCSLLTFNYSEIVNSIWNILKFITWPTKRRKNCSRTTNGSSNQLQPDSVGRGGRGSLNVTKKFNSGL